MALSIAKTLIACTFLAVISTAAVADECKLGRIGSVDFAQQGAVVIPVSIEGNSSKMVIDTGAMLSGVDPEAAADFHLLTHRIYQGAAYDAKGEMFTQMAVIHAFGIGEMRANDVRLLVWPSRMWSDPGVAGTLGADLLRNYDVDIDFGEHKLNLFSQDHCPGKVVYWSSDNVAVVPMHVVNSGHIILPVTLDGHELDAVLDTGASYSILSAEAAHNIFGLTPDSPDMVKFASNGGVFSGSYRHTFKSLSLQGLAIQNPSIVVHENLMRLNANRNAPTGSRLGDSGESGGVTDLILGLSELRHLHIYIAYREQKLYISPAAVPLVAATAGTPATHASATPPAASH